MLATRKRLSLKCLFCQKELIQLDDINTRLLELLQTDGRMTILQLSKELNLSRPSIKERLKKLQDSHVIQGFTVRIFPEAIGKAITVIIAASDVKVECKKFEEIIKKELDIIECHRVTGLNSYIMKAAVPSVKHVEQLVDRLIPFAHINTSVVLSSPILDRAILPEEATDTE